jgi:hypothetical protein
VLASGLPAGGRQRRKQEGGALPAILVGARKEFTVRILSTLAMAVILAAPATAGSAQQLRIGTSFVGSTYGTDSFVFPPDTNGAVGPRHIVELLNGHYAAYRKNNGSRIASSSLDQFWRDGGAAPRGFVVDPRVVFDPVANRWYASTLSINSGNGPDDLLFAVSREDDPTQGWVGFSVPFAGPVGTFGDFPTLGFNSESVFVFSNGSVLVVPKVDLLAPAPTLARSTLLQSRDLLTPGGTKIQPAVNLDNSAAALLLGTWDVEGSVMRIWRLSGGPVTPVLEPDAAFVNLAFYPVLGPGGALQPQSGIGISPSSPFLASSIVLRNGLLWGAQTVSNLGRAALRWFVIDPTTHTRVQEGLISDASHDFFMGSIAVNGCGDVLIGFNRSGTDQFVSVYAVAGTTENNVTTFGDPVLLRAGVARYELTGGAPAARWGDYSATVADPQHRGSFWTFQEWPSAPDVWSTQVTELRVHREGGGGACRTQ